jgi:hypothetical protein
MITALEGGKGSASRPGRSLPPGKTRYPLYRRLGGSQGRSGQVPKISPSPEFDPRTVQPVASRHTDYATRNTVTLGQKMYFAWTYSSPGPISRVTIYIFTTFKNRSSYIQDGRTATLQMLHFIYFFQQI